MTENKYPENLKQWLIYEVYNGDTNSGFINVGMTKEIREQIAQIMAPLLFNALMDAQNYDEFTNAIIHASPTPGYIKRPCRTIGSEPDFLNELCNTFDSLFVAFEKDGGKTKKDLYRNVFEWGSDDESE